VNPTTGKKSPGPIGKKGAFVFSSLASGTWDLGVSEAVELQAICVRDSAIQVGSCNEADRPGCADAGRPTLMDDCALFAAPRDPRPKRPR
jgi:hypothetical protein